MTVHTLFNWMTHKEKNQRHIFFFTCLIFSHGQSQKCIPEFLFPKRKCNRLILGLAMGREEGILIDAVVLKRFHGKRQICTEEWQIKRKRNPLCECYLSFLIYAVSKD